MESSRLKGKSMMPIANKPLIFRIMERLSRCKEIDNLVLAIPSTRANDIISKIKFIGSVKIFRGSQNNLLERYYLAAKKYKTDIVVRVPGDNCMPEPSEIDKIIKFYKKFRRPLFVSNLSNILKNKYPDGIGAEVFGFNFLEDLMKKKLAPKFKEHIHLNFFDYKNNRAKNEKWCRVKTIKCPKKISRPNLSLDVNTLKEYNFINKIYNTLYKNNKIFTIKNVIKFLDKNNEH
jgi:spore coat polysaccharide biosynthesis protein SpsF